MWRRARVSLMLLLPSSLSVWLRVCAESGEVLVLEVKHQQLHTSECPAQRPDVRDRLAQRACVVQAALRLVETARTSKGRKDSDPTRSPCDLRAAFQRYRASETGIWVGLRWVALHDARRVRISTRRDCPSASRAGGENGLSPRRHPVPVWRKRPWITVGVRVERVDPGGSEWRRPYLTHAHTKTTTCRIDGGGHSLSTSAALRPI